MRGGFELIHANCIYLTRQHPLFDGHENIIDNGSGARVLVGGC